MAMVPWLVILALLILIPVAIIATIYLILPLCRAVGWLVEQVARFVVATVTDAVRLVGSTLSLLVLLPVMLFRLALGHWSAGQHIGRAVQAEFTAAARCLYRLLVAHPLRLLGLGGVLEGVEQRVPAVLRTLPPATNTPFPNAPYANAPPGPFTPGPSPPNPDAPHPSPAVPAPAAHSPAAHHARSPHFDGYTILGTLPGGGSGGRLYVARPDQTKALAFQRRGLGPVGDVVIKCFVIGAHGPAGGHSTLPQVVRESRALEAARKLGLVLDHELTPDRFYYVTRYVPGDALSVVTPQLHARSAPGGLDAQPLADSLAYAVDLLATLRQYHAAGLWHKDVKPDNIIVAQGRAHVVDFGLVTPLRSSMTLTTHGTEYFRDPEMVRLALRGVKVHEVDGAKFDVYAAGAVIFSMIENSFPAHGGLSQVTRRCPEALRWIIRRAMTDYDKRYPSAQAMLDDLLTVQNAHRAGSLDALRPADLPSQRALHLDDPRDPHAPDLPPHLAPDAAPAPVPHQPAVSPPPRGPAAVEPPQAPLGRYARGPSPADARAGGPGHAPRPSAREQLQSARARVHARRAAARDRLHRFRSRNTLPDALPAQSLSAHRHLDRPNPGVLAGVAALLVVTVLICGGLIFSTGPGPGVRMGGAPVTLDVQAESATASAAPLALALERLPAWATPPNPRPDPFPARVLLIDDAPALAAPARDAVAAWLDAARQNRVAVVAGLPHAQHADPADPAALAAEIELIANARNSIGLAPHAGDAARRALADFIARHDDLDGVLWITRRTPNAGAPQPAQHATANADPGPGDAHALGGHAHAWILLRHDTPQPVASVLTTLPPISAAAPATTTIPARAPATGF